MILEIGGELTPGDLIAVTGYRNIFLAIYIEDGKGTIRYYPFNVMANAKVRAARLNTPLKMYNKSYTMNPKHSAVKLIPELNLNREQLDNYMEYMAILKELGHLK